MTTPLYPTFRKRIDDAVELLLQNQVTPWSFLNSGKPFRVKKFDGREVAYEGASGFDGSLREVYWARYIEPFLEDLTVREINAAVSSAQERGVDAKLLLPEVQSLLRDASRRVFSRMAQIDQRLMGKGYPKNVPLRRVEHEVESMDQFIEERIHAELAMWKPKPHLKDRLSSRPSNAKSINWPSFIIGCVLLAAALIAFFWAFSLDHISPSRHFLLMWLLPLASGFSCICFAGSMRISGPLGNLAIAATGGFAVWVLSFYLLPKIPDSPTPLLPANTTIAPAK